MLRPDTGGSSAGSLTHPTWSDTSYGLEETSRRPSLFESDPFSDPLLAQEFSTTYSSRVDVLAGDRTGWAVFRVDCDPPRTKARPARLVAVLAAVRDGVAFFFRQSGVIGFLGRCIAAFLKQDR